VTKTLVTISFLILCLQGIAQDTSYYLKAKINSSSVEWVTYEINIKGISKKTFRISPNWFWVNHKLYYSDTLARAYNYQLTPHIPNKIKDSKGYDPFSLAVTPTFDEEYNMTGTAYYGGDYLLPCQCLEAMVDNDTIPDLACILNCKYDTISFKQSIIHYNKNGDLTTVFRLSDGDTAQSENRRYNENGLCTASYSGKTAFLTKYDDLGRKSWESYNHGNVENMYELVYEYKDSITLIFGLEDGLKRLTEKSIAHTNGDSQEIVYFFDSSVEIINFKNGIKHSKEKYGNGSLTEKWEFIHSTETGKNITTALKNSDVNYRIIEETW
jgi:hypothetical protein